MAITRTVLDTVGNTPLVELCRVVPKSGAKVLVKLEYFNPLSSVKDRVGLAMVKDAEDRGLLEPGATLIEPTSGNTGIALAFVAAARGYRIVLTLPDNASQERIRLLTHLGAEVELTSANRGMMGAVQRAKSIHQERPGSVLLQQFENPANPAAHEATTGPEIWRDTEGAVDVFVAGVGTGGTISGVSRFLKSKKPGVLSVAVEPHSAAVLSGKPPAPHPIQGIGAGFIPGNLDRSVLDRVVPVRAADAFKMARRLAKEEGILAGISSGANVHAAVQEAKKPENAGKTIVTVICSCGERYLSTPLFK